MLEESSVVGFLSADLAGATAYKNRHPANPKNFREDWASDFERFYVHFDVCLQRAWKHVTHDNLQLSQQAPVFLKAIGDEVIFTVELKRHQDAVLMVKAFLSALNEYSGMLASSKRELGVKGTAWIAGFPVNNRVIDLPTASPSSGIKSPCDYLGPSIDAGFRLAAYSSPRHMTISVDLALLIASDSSENFHFVFGGMTTLKGVLNGTPYPVIWCPTNFEAIEDTLTEKPRQIDSKTMGEYCRKYIESAPSPDSWLIVPYFKNDNRFNTPPDWHKEVFQIEEVEDKKTSEGLESVGQENEAGESSLKAITQKKVLKVRRRRAPVRPARKSSFKKNKRESRNGRVGGAKKESASQRRGAKRV